MDSFDQQFAGIVQRWQPKVQAFSCAGDTRSAVIWHAQSQITLRLHLIEDEVWIIVGSGTLLRFVSASDGEFDHSGIDHVIEQVLAGNAIEYFGAVGHEHEDVIAVGYRIGEGPAAFTGGLSQNHSRFRARIAGPMAAAQLDELD